MLRRWLAALAVLVVFLGGAAADARRGEHGVKQARDGRPPGFTAVKDGWQSPAGLVYRRDAASFWLDGVKSTMTHMRDAPDRPLHGVFHKLPLAMIDEAWRRAQAGTRGVRRFTTRTGDVIEVDMGHPTGWLGGRIGRELGNPTVRHLRLVLDQRKRLMSAYPSQPLLKGATKPPEVPARSPKAPRPTGPPEVWKVSRPAVSHTLFGLPSPGGAAQDTIVARERYTISYNRTRKVLNWASWSLVREDFGGAKRQGDYRHDPEAEGTADASDDEFPWWMVGWSRGHMVPSGESTASPHLNSSTHLKPNIFPQAENVNAGPWNDLENWYRNEVKFQGKDAHLIAGTIFDEHPKVLADGTQVPKEIFKIVVLLDRGQTLADVTARTKVVAVIMPNTNAVTREMKWPAYETTVAEIERRTGLRFFQALPPDVAAKLKGSPRPRGAPLTLLRDKVAARRIAAAA